MGEFRMPSLGADMEEGVLVEWFVGEGDRVARGDVIAAVDTDKATIDVEVFDNGVVQRLLVEPGTTVPVGAPLAVIADGAVPEEESPEPADVVADVAAPAAPVVPPAAPAAPSPFSDAVDREPVSGGARLHHASHVLSPVVRQLADRLGVDVSTVDGSGPGGRVTRSDVERAGSHTSAHRGGARAPRSSPRARRRAEELGVDLAHVRGTGPGGAVREADVLASTGPAAPPPGATTGTPVEPLGDGAEGGLPPAGEDRRATMRRAIARTMSRSNRDIPHYHLTHLVDLTVLQSWLERTNATRGPGERVLPAAALLKAVALAAAEVPELNGVWEEDGFRATDEVNLAFAVSLRGGGLIAPVLHGADRMPLDSVMGAMRDLVQRSRRGGLRGTEMEGATLTVTNLGDRGVDTVHGVIHPPQVALVGAGRIAERAVVVQGEVVARPSVVLTLAADHRATDGQTGSRMLARIGSLLQEPSEL
jgi:pyruvate dehydrogenase E2 component (dihydrolipoamide acetyltransferase)